MKKNKQQQEKTPKKNNERLTEREWREIRSEFKPTYRRVRGAIRNK